MDYVYPQDADGYNGLTYYANKGIQVVRLPFRWERMQHSLNGPLDPEELSHMDDFISQASALGMKVIIEPHNYGRYCGSWTVKVIGCGEDKLIGTPKGASIAAFADFWQRLANHYKDNTGVYAFDLMNEPTYTHGEAPSIWRRAAQAAVNAIRQVDTSHLILVPGSGWSSAQDWLSYNKNLIIKDPANNLMYEAHQYFDKDQSGEYDEGYNASGAYPDIGIDRVKPFVNWLHDNSVRGFIGEYGIPGNDKRWLTVMDHFLTYLDDQCIGATYWAGGPWWGNYNLSIEPRNGQDSPQMTVLEKHLGVECSNPNLVYYRRARLPAARRIRGVNHITSMARAAR
jgi:endoglucanase